MRILLFHPVLLPPKHYGGVERVVLWLAKGLIQKGHIVKIAALKGSQLPENCQLVEVEKKEYSATDFSRIVDQAVVDVVHFMAPIGQKLWDDLSFPRLLTVHGNGKPDEKYPKNTVFLSQDHAKRHGSESFIFNGIDPSEYLFQPHKSSKIKKNYLFLSKTNWSVKNLSGTIRYCRKAQVSLKIAGGNRPYFKRLSCFFLKGIDWIGPVSGEKKAELLVDAEALLFPVIWSEPFGLVVAEALMSGTPVFASPRGSMIEMLPKGVGALLNSEQEWIDQLQKGAQLWDPQRCRDWAMEKFHFLKMAENYEKTYQKVISNQTL